MQLVRKRYLRKVTEKLELLNSKVLFEKVEKLLPASNWTKICLNVSKFLKIYH